MVRRCGANEESSSESMTRRIMGTFREQFNKKLVINNQSAPNDCLGIAWLFVFAASVVASSDVPTRGYSIFGNALEQFKKNCSRITTGAKKNRGDSSGYSIN